MGPRLIALLGGILLIYGGILLGQAGIVWGKAVLAEPLMVRAFEKGVLLGAPQKPWPWADHRVKARLTLEQNPPTNSREGQKKVIYGLSGDGMRAMAFGPVTYDQGLATVMIAHRDSHFYPLKQVKMGDGLTLDRLGNGRENFRVKAIWVAHKDALYLPDAGHQKGLLLITCYPFDSAETGGPLRTLVWAEPDGQSS